MDLKSKLKDVTIEQVKTVIADQVPEAFAKIVVDFVNELWDEIYTLYMKHYNEEDVKVWLDFVEHPVYQKFLAFNKEYQPWIVQKMTDYFDSRSDDVEKILEEEEADNFKEDVWKAE